jgi:chromosome segregation ATPase
MASNATTADVAPGGVTSTESSEDDAGETNDHSLQLVAELSVSGANAISDATSEEYSSRISTLSDQIRSLRASYALALQDREDAEKQETLCSKRLDAEMLKSNTMKKEMRAIESSKAELHCTLNQLQTDAQKESCTVTEHELLQDELQELDNKHQQLEKQHNQQSIMLAEFQKENDSLEGRLSNIGVEKSQRSITESGVAAQVPFC